MKRLNSNQIKGIELDILKEFANYCDSNNLNYYLAYGTLLGAVRHKGFIPWDDDIDVMMTRSDYEKLHELVKKNPVRQDLALESFELGTYRAPYAKIVNTNTITNTYGRGLEERLWIDIFVIDNYNERVRNINKICYSIFIAMDTKHFKINLKGLAKWILRLIFFWKDKREFVSEMRERVLVVPNNGKFANMLWAGKGENSVFESKDLDKPKYVDFEGGKFKSFADPHVVLSSYYGDYMTLPPLDKRVTHEIEAYWLSDAEIPIL